MLLTENKKIKKKKSMREKKIPKNEILKIIINQTNLTSIFASHFFL